VHSPTENRSTAMTVITQPGMRYVQAETLVERILSDDTFRSLDIMERNAVLERIRSEIKGRMMEEIVLLETRLANPKKRVFKLQFAVGEFDMVICDEETLTCRIYEIKHSKEVVPAQYRHLTDTEKCRTTEHQFGRIVGKYVIYRGEPFKTQEVEYLNVEQYLRTVSLTL